MEEKGGSSFKAAILALFRLRNLFILILGAGASLFSAIIIKWWLLFLGMLLTTAALGWSVHSALQDPKFLAEVDKPALSAAVSSDVALAVASKRGSPLLSGPLNEEHKRLASIVGTARERISQWPEETKILVEDLPSQMASLLKTHEALAQEKLKLEESASEDQEDSERLEKVEAELSSIRKAFEDMDERFAALEEGHGGDVSGQLARLSGDVDAIERAVGDLKLLE